MRGRLLADRTVFLSCRRLHLFLFRGTLKKTKQIDYTMSQYLCKCLQTELIDADKLFAIEDRLGVNLRGR